MVERITRDSVAEEDSATEENPVDFIHTGCTLLNLAASQKGIGGGWARGRIDNIVGDGSSGKTLLALEAAANCFYNMLGSESYNFPTVNDVSIVYNNVEGVMDFPVDLMYGKEFNEGVEWLRTGTIQDFGRDFLKRVMAIKSGQFLLYIVDSWDALDSEDEYEAFLKTIEEDTPQEGSFDLGKQKYGSKRFFKTLCSKIEGDNGKVKKDVTLMIISQVRKKIGIVFGEPLYRAGGDALNFYTHQVCWLADKGKIVPTREKIKVTTGIKVKARFKRNKASKPFREADFPIMFDYGIDDITSMLQFLYGEKPKELGKLFDKEFKQIKAAASYIDKNNLEEDLARLVEEKWNRVELAAKFDRKRRFPK